MIKSFLSNTDKFKSLYINSYANSLDVESLQNLDRFSDFRLRLYENPAKVSAIVSQFTSLENLELTVSKPSDILDLGHLKYLKKVTIRYQQNSNHVIWNSHSESNSVPMLTGFNINNIILPDHGLQSLVIDA